MCPFLILSKTGGNFENGVQIWRPEAVGNLAIIIQNTRQQPLAFRVKTMQLLLPKGQQ